MKRSLLVHYVGHHDLLAIAESNGQRRTFFPNSYRLCALYEALSNDAINIDGRISGGTLHGDSILFTDPFQLDTKYLKTSYRKNSGEGKQKTEASLILGMKFPILTSSIDRWLNETDGVEHDLFIITTKPEEEILKSGSSYGMGRLIQTFVEKKYLNVFCRLLSPFEGNPFKHDDLVDYMRSELHTKIEALRDSVVKPDTEEWQNDFNVYLSLSSGTIPIITGIYACTRLFKPKHIFAPEALKRIDENQSLETDVLDFDTIEHTPSVSVDKCRDSGVKEISREMREWAGKYSSSQRDSFWLRKGKKPVLAILAYRNMDKSTSYIRSCNLEVSLPTGSLCAERNAIGTLIATEPGIHRSSFLMIAVLSLPNETGQHLNPLSPCGVCREWLLKIAEVNPSFKILKYDDIECNRVYISSLI